MEENSNITKNDDGVEIKPSNIIARVIGIITKPKEEWAKIAKEKASPQSVIIGYAIPLALIPAIATIIGLGLIGRRIGFMSITFKSWGYGITSGITVFVSSLVAVILTAFIIDALAKSFKSEKDFTKSLQLAVYSYTPAWIAGILNIIPSLSWLSFIAGLYGIYLMFLAFSPIKKTPEENRIGYLLVTVGILIVTYFIVALILGAIIAMFYAPRLANFY